MFKSYFSKLLSLLMLMCVLVAYISYHDVLIGSRNSKSDTSVFRREGSKMRKNCNNEGTLSKIEECKKRDQFINDTTIVVLINWKFSDDVNRVKTKLLPSLNFFKTMNFIFFSEEDPPDAKTQAEIRKISHHRFQFLKTEFSFPKGFDSNSDNLIYVKRSTWGYVHMMRFWFRNVWLEPEVRKFKYVYRFDTDSCLRGTNYTFPADDSIVYSWLKVVNDRCDFIVGLKNYVMKYVERNGITPKHKALFQQLKTTQTFTVPAFLNNIEITSVDFMHRPDVKKFIDTVEEKNYQYIYRWGDGPLRFVVIAMFADVKSVYRMNIDLHRDYFHVCH